jgi:putative ABC transport system ATP-binding protein
MSIVEFEGAARVYGRGETAATALTRVTLAFGQGEMAALLGPSGSGKTTLLNLAGGLDRPSAGTVRLLGHDLGRLSETALALLRRRHVGVVFQALNLVAVFTAAENIGIPLDLNGVGPAERDRRVGELLDLAGLADRAGALPGELSGGEQQRIAVLRAVAHRPALVLLDEPTSSLDTAHAQVLMDLLLRLNEEEHTTMLIATHDERVARRTRRRVQLLDGEVIRDGVTDSQPHSAGT